VITLHRLQVAGRDCYQAVLTRPSGEALRSPLFLRREEVVRWAVQFLQAAPTPSTSPSKAGT